MPVNTILGLFAKSPIKPLQKHIERVQGCCERLLPFFLAISEDDWSRAEQLHAEIQQLEKEANLLKREIRLKLPRGLFMPLARTDLLELLVEQDLIANRAKEIVGLVLGRQLAIPAELNEDFTQYLTRCIDATALAARAIGELDELLETGFRGREVDLVESMVHELDLIEDDTDRLQVELRRRLLEIEARFNPVDVMFLYKLLETIGDLANQAECVGARLELMLARS